MGVSRTRPPLPAKVRAAGARDVEGGDGGGRGGGALQLGQTAGRFAAVAMAAESLAFLNLIRRWLPTKTLRRLSLGVRAPGGGCLAGEGPRREAVRVLA